MKYYESNFDEYLCSYEHCNIHPELNDIKSKFPKNITEFKNLIIYGPPGVGKYTQTLSILQIYSPSKLKYDKKISMCRNNVKDPQTWIKSDAQSKLIGSRDSQTQYLSIYVHNLAMYDACLSSSLVIAMIIVASTLERRIAQ